MVRREWALFRREPLPFVVILMLAAGGFFGRSWWFVGLGARVLLALSFPKFSIIVDEAFARHTLRSNLVVWGSLAAQSLMFAVASFAAGVGIAHFW